MSLSDFFSKEDRKKILIPNGIQIGTVIRAYTTTARPPKTKRFVIIGFKDDDIHLAILLINSKINPNFKYSDELIAHQIFLESNGREYLEHDSYVDCSEIHTLNLSELNQGVDNKPEIVIGQVNKEDMDLLMHTLINSEIIKGKIKKKCGFYNYKT